MPEPNLIVNGSTQLGNASTDTVEVAGDLTVNGNTQLGNASADTVNVAGDLTVNGNINGVADQAAKLQTARTIALTGDATGSASFDGSNNVSIAVTVPGGGSGTMLKSVYDTNNNGVVDQAAKLQTARTIALTGGATGSASFDGSSNVSIAVTVPSSSPDAMLKSVYDTNNNGVVDQAAKLQTARTISVTGDATGSASFDGTANVSIAVTVPGAGSGSMLKSVYDTNNNGVVDQAAKLQTARTISLTGGVTGSVSFDGTANASISATVVQDSTHRFVTDAEKAAWNAGAGGGATAIYVNVKDFGAVGNGVANDTTAIQNAINSATANGTVSNTVFFPAGTYKITAQITAFGANIIGAGMMASVIKCTAALGTDVPCFILDDIANMPQSGSMANIGFEGPGVRSLGVKTAGVSGIEVRGQNRLSYVRVRQFDKGIIENAQYGHTSLIGVVSADNYYGYYAKFNFGDLLITDSAINGNTFANIAIPSSPWGISAFKITRTHLGFAPYAIYQEAGGTGNFLANGIMEMVAMESCGNGAIFSETAAPLSNNGGVFNVKIVHPGFSWNDSYKIPSRNKNYAVVVGLTGGQCEYWAGGYPFQNGTLGSWLFQNNYAVWDFQMHSTEIVKVASGRQDFFEIRRQDATRFGSDQIPTGATYVLINTGLKVPESSINPIVTPTHHGGLSGAFSLLITNKGYSANNEVIFYVNRHGGGTSTEPISFNYFY